MSTRRRAQLLRQLENKQPSSTSMSLPLNPSNSNSFPMDTTALSTMGSVAPSLPTTTVSSSSSTPVSSEMSTSPNFTSLTPPLLYSTSLLPMTSSLPMTMSMQPSSSSYSAQPLLSFFQMKKRVKLLKTIIRKEYTEWVQKINLLPTLTTPPTTTFKNTKTFENNLESLPPLSTEFKRFLNTANKFETFLSKQVSHQKKTKLGNINEIERRSALSSSMSISPSPTSGRKKKRRRMN
ncbi:hypothetical protein HMI56_003417 [Coelomomyces lativittatus]|nr:hypothetical protein HMI56_003417 [Coelomomyces lativittatus]